MDPTIDTKPNEHYADARGGTNYDLKNAVKLPELEDKREWIAVHLFSFHRQVSMLYGTIFDHCDTKNCPQMTAGKLHKYLWSSGPAREPVELSARDYITLSLDWIREQIDDEDIFPRMDKKFPENFLEICEIITRRLFRVFAHIYHQHMTHIREAKIEAHVNTNLKHFIYFGKEFNLIKSKELEPLQDYISKLKP